MSPSSTEGGAVRVIRSNSENRSLCCRLHSDYDFAPVIFETSGALNKEGEIILKQIIRFASKREGITHTVYAARAWARLSCCVQAASAQQILNCDFVDWSDVGTFLINSCSSDEPSMTSLFFFFYFVTFFSHFSFLSKKKKKKKESQALA